MSYVSENLMKDEEIIYEGKTHWATFISVRGLLSLGILPFLDMKTNSFGITNKRVIMKNGIISTNLVENGIQKIDAINVKKSLLARIFGYGTIIVANAGSTTGFPYVANADEFKRKFNEASM